MWCIIVINYPVSAFLVPLKKCIPYVKFSNAQHVDKRRSPYLSKTPLPQIVSCRSLA